MKLNETSALIRKSMLALGDNLGRSLVKPGAKELAERLKKKTPLSPPKKEKDND